MSDQLNSSLYGAVQLATENSILPDVDPMWVYASEIDGSRWDEQFPYQLMVLTQGIGNSDYTITETFTLPIPPQDLDTQTPFAISTSVLLGGIVEQHNGAPVRPISLNGTMGVLPARPSAASLPSLNLAQAIFAGSVSSAQSIVDSAAGVSQQASAALSGTKAGAATNAFANVVFSDDTDPGGDLEKTTGYYQFLLLRRFLESYITAKKTVAGANLRLSFCNWKDNEVYLVTPLVFNGRRTAQSPWEYRYSLSFKAWKRINLQGATGNAPVNSNSPNTYTPGTLQAVLSTVNAARELLFSFTTLGSVFGAIIGDTTLIAETMRSLALYASDALGQTPTLADLPAGTIASMKAVVLAYIGSNPQVISNLNQFQMSSASGAFSASFVQGINALKQLGSQSQKSNIQYGNPNGLGSNLNALSGSDSTHPANVFFENPTESYEMFSAIAVGSLSIPPAVSAQIVAERQRVRAFTRTDFANMREQIIQAMVDFGNKVGQGNDTYNRTFNVTPPPAVRQATDDDFDIICALNSMALSLGSLAAFGRTQVAPNPMDYVAGFAAQFNVPFDSITSKFSVPFPYGSTLEMLALRYLGDPNKWLEIATLNGLQEPYVDETGFSYALLTNGNGNEIVLGSATNLFINQYVYLSSNATQRTQRHITKIRPLSTGTFVITLDGDSDLSRFTTIAQASLSAFLPNTVNSQQTIYIPSKSAPSQFALNSPPNPAVDPNAVFLAVGGVDLLLTQTGDLAITADGDCRLAMGLTNIIQKAWLAMNTPQKSLLQHPEYGIEVPPGTSIADLSAQDILASTRSLFKGDPTFTGVKAAAVNIGGPTAQLAISVGIAGYNQLLPLTVDIK